MGFLRVVDAIEVDAFGVVLVQDFEGGAVKDGDNGTGKGGERGIGTNKEDETCQ
jgi:hypothetical protein